jgi:hypothetical protein
LFVCCEHHGREQLQQTLNYVFNFFHIFVEQLIHGTRKQCQTIIAQLPLKKHTKALGETKFGAFKVRRKKTLMRLFGQLSN